MGNWAAKARIEYYALNRDIVSPFNSRGLLKLLLSSHRSLRDSHYNLLYDQLIYELSEADEDLCKIPINPSKKQAVIRVLKRLRLYNSYKYITLKARM